MYDSPFLTTKKTPTTRQQSESMRKKTSSHESVLLSVSASKCLILLAANAKIRVFAAVQIAINSTSLQIIMD